MPPFASPEHAARNAAELLDYLAKHDGAEYAYRGQTQEYPPPLVPSAYRLKRPTGVVYGRDAPEYRHSLRKVGRRFVGIHPFRNFSDIFRAYAREPGKADATEVELVRRLAHDAKAAEAMSKLGFEAALRSILPADVFSRYESRLPVWESVLERHHRALIRLNGCNEFLGYRLGQTLSQHYVENSEFLDVTASPEVALFFATHAGDGAEPRSGIGVVYRFRIGDAWRDPKQDYDYYTAPAYIDAREVVESLESTEPQWSPREFVVYYLMAGRSRYWETLRLGESEASRSRIGAQHAAFLVPDELRVEDRDEVGRQHVSFQAVEDLAEREGTDRFYFRQSEFETGLQAETLWPVDGEGERRFLDLVRRITLSERELETAAGAMGTRVLRAEYADLWIPPRPELLQTGRAFAAAPLERLKERLQAESDANRAGPLFAAFSEFVGYRPEWTQLHFATLAELVDQGHAAFLRDAFQAALNDDSASVPAWYGLGLISQMTNRDEEAVRAFRSAVKLDPSSGVLRYNLGVALHKLQQLDDARARYQEALQCDETLAEPHFGLAAICMRTNRPAKAKEHLQTFLQLAPDYLKSTDPYRNACRMVAALEASDPGTSGS